MSVESKVTSAVEVNAVNVDAMSSKFHAAVYVDDFYRELKYVCDPTNIWKHEAYRNAKINGKLASGDDISFHLQYLLGNAFFRGHTDKIYFNIFFRDLQGFHVQVASSYKELDELKRWTFTEKTVEWQIVYAKLLEFHQSSK